MSAGASTSLDVATHCSEVVRRGLSSTLSSAGDFHAIAGGAGQFATLARRPLIIGQPVAQDHVIAAATTSYAGSHPARAKNLELGAQRLDGTVLPPGAAFSLMERIGPLSIANGYTVGYGIVVEDGVAATVESVGGGVSQVATTLFQAVFWAGYEVQHRVPHSYWIDRYVDGRTGMLGLEATIDQAGIDFRFRNDGPGDLTIRTRVDGEQLTVELIGDPPDWTVNIVSYEIGNVEPPRPGLTRWKDVGQRPGERYYVAKAACGFNVEVVREVVGAQIGRRVLRAKAKYVPTAATVVDGTRAW